MILTRAKWALRGFALALVAYTNNPVLAKAQPSKAINADVRFVPPPPPSTGVPSGRQKGGSSRGSCPAPAKNKTLTALVPATQRHLAEKPGINPALTTWESVWGLTVSASPTFWFYVPYSLTPKLTALFVLQDEKGNHIYTNSLITSVKQSSIAKISLPSTIVLDVGKMYHWYFVIDCHPDAPPQVNGWIQRKVVSPTLNIQLKKANPQQRVTLYATNGIWYDALNTLAGLRSANSQNAIIANSWFSLLSSVGLESITSEPIAY